MRDLTFKLLAIVVSIALHSLLFANLTEKNITEKETKKREATPIKISLVQPIQKPTPKKEIPKKKVVKKTPKVKPKPKPKKIIKPKPKKIIKKEPKKEVIQKPTPPKKIEPKNVIAPKPLPIKKEKDYSGEKNLFLIDLKKRIEANKEYPRSARRRGIEGDVSISFTINKNGKLQDLRLVGNKLLKKASQIAIENSFPVEKKVFFPMDIQLQLQFRLY